MRKRKQLNSKLTVYFTKPTSFLNKVNSIGFYVLKESKKI